MGDVSGPHHRRPQQSVECDVAVPGVPGGPGQHEDDVEPEPRACGGGQAGVIALAGPAGDQRVRATSQCGAAEPLQLAHLVAATTEPGEVVALHPEIGGAESERTRQSRRGLERESASSRGELASLQRVPLPSPRRVAPLEVDRRTAAHRCSVTIGF